VESRGISLDIVTIGRSCVDLYGEQIGGRLEDMASFAKYIGGSPTNTAIGLARLGLRAGLLTGVGNDHFGRFIREELEREGVDTRGVKTDPQRLTALAILGIRNQVDFPLIFYRENCADMALSVFDVDTDLFRSTRAVLINGTHLSTPSVADASKRACEIARAAGGRVVFDIDYRPVLWGLTSRDMGENRFVESTRVTEKLQQVLPLCDLIVGTQEEIHILGGSTDTVSALRAIRSASRAVIVLKRGADGCICYDGTIPDNLLDGLCGPAFKVEVFNILGAGDGFMAGFLSGWLKGAPLPECCELGNACGALVVSRHGCAPAMPTSQELRHFLGDPHRPYRLREHPQLENLHWSTARIVERPELMVLAMDHRSQFIQLADEIGVPHSKIGEFKSLALAAVDRVAEGDPAFGVLMDGQFGRHALEQASDLPYWIGRPIEQPGSCPVAFVGSPDVGIELREWPLRHVVKCLIQDPRGQAEGIQERQEQQLLRLFNACRSTRHEFLLEIIGGKHSSVEFRVARLMERLYSIGLRPDWWKLEPAADSATWADIQRVVSEFDPHCQGVVVLGLAASEKALLKSFAASAAYPIVKGFAVGRTIWWDAARQWFSGTIDAATAEKMISERLATLARGWRAARNSLVMTAEGE
jgi:5-dehydro-2-deoxygluconokinase